MRLALSDRNRRLLAPCLGMLLLVMLLLLVSLNSVFVAEPPEKIITHEARSYTPPPPPPPPPKKQQGSSGSPKPSLARARIETPVELEVMDLKADIGAGRIGGIGAGGRGDGYGLGGGSGGWEIVGLSELDNIPMVRSAGIMSYPEEAVQQDVLDFRVEIHIVIDEEGRAHPIRILKNPFPSMNEEIMKYVSNTTFTPPTKLGVRVRTAYLWPLRMKKPVSMNKK